MKLNKKAWFAISIAILGTIFCLIFPPFDSVIVNVDLIARLVVLGIIALLIIIGFRKKTTEQKSEKFNERPIETEATQPEEKATEEENIE